MYRRLRRSIVGLLALSLLAGCQILQTPPPPMTPVTLQLKWLHQAQFAGFYAAAEADYFAQEGLDVTLLEGGPSINGIERVLNDEADFGLAGAEQILQQRSLGKPIVAIATTYRRNPFILVSLAESGIAKPEDLIGKTVAIGGNAGELQVRAMMEFMGLDYSQINIVPFSLDLTPFYAGEVDVVPAFSAGSFIPMRDSGHQFNQIWPDDYGIHFYSDTIFATEQTVRERPELVTRFLRAVLHGHRTVVEKPDESVQYAMHFLKDADPAIQSQMILASLPLINTGEDEIGWMQPEVWQGMYDTLLKQGFIQNPMDVNQAFTAQFLQAIYSDKP